MDELYRSKAIKLMEQGIEAAAEMESHLKEEQKALVSQDASALEGMVEIKRGAIDRLASFEAEIMALLKSVDITVASDNWVEVIKRFYPADHRIDQTVGNLRSRISACHHLTVENEGLVNIGLARVSVAMQMLSGEENENLYTPRGPAGSNKRGSRSLAHI